MDELVFSKINDKIKFCNSKNKITHTDFFTEPEIIKIKKYLQQKNIHNFFFLVDNLIVIEKCYFFIQKN